MTNDEALVSALLEDWQTAPVDAKEMAMLEYAVMITEDAEQIGPETLDGLRAHGYDDTAILQMAAIASWFNYINRMADALGVGR
ncbi:MAG: hypothetical protein O2973_01585 [Gemmatimonadetes bacterium]|nr:hypothetical protein [Gemmatimonadota bacterium]